MSTHSVAEAASQLSDLIDRALEGDAVVITRDGRPVVEIKPVKTQKRRMTKEDLAWIEANRVKLCGEHVDPVAVLLKMRDEDWP